MNPNKSTREEFTSGLTTPSLPDFASQQWTELARKLRKLLDKLGQHTAMAPNLQQTYMTPAASKNKVYFMWDFVGRTLLSNLYKVDPTLENLSEDEQQKWMMDVVGRSHFAGMLILDTNNGMLDKMVESTYSDQAGQHPEFSEEILEIARTL